MNNPLNHANGALPSKPDYRSAIIASATAQSYTQTPIVTKIRTDFSKLGAPLNQMQTPACVSHVIAMLMRLWWYLKTGQVVLFSPRFLHIMSGLPQYNGGWAAGPNDGRDPITVLKIAKNYGCATVATLPNDTTLSDTDYFNAALLTPAVMNDAAQYKIPGYVAPLVSQANIRTLIMQHGGVALTFRVGNSLWTDKNGNVTYAQAAIDPVRPPTSPADAVNGHELLGNGFDASVESFLNEWGPNWANNGESDWIWNEWQAYVAEIAAIADVPGDALALVQGLPLPNEFKHNFASNIVYGQQSDEVRALQIALAIDGEDVYPEITGYYGTVTAAAVMAFQTKHGVADSATIASLAGKSVGPLTRVALNVALATRLDPRCQRGAHGEAFVGTNLSGAPSSSFHN
jgi:hypothetical protein